jgi:quercetin dioxygenase-like cupin family protein
MQQPRSTAARWLAIVAVVALALLTLVPAAFARGPRGAHDDFSVTHAAVQTTLTTPGSDGHQLGDLRVTSIPVTVEGTGQTGRLDSTLTTVGIDQPNPGDEVRISVLVFSFDDNADQIVVNGTATYPKAGSTLATNTTVVRPITGGSGAFDGATGYAESEHLADGTWRHTFHLAGGWTSGMMDGPMGMGRDRQMGRGMGHGRGHGLMGAPAASATPAAPAASTAPAASAAPTAGIVRTLLGSVDPSTAAGQTLSLWQYDIPAGSALTPHTHPGFQVARIASGTLTYDVISGEATVLRADGTTETATTGAEIVLNAGDTIIENPDLQHFGANKGTEPVVIVSASLFAADEPPSAPLPSASPAA